MEDGMEKGEKIRANIKNGTVLWSQSPDTDWYRQGRELPVDYFRLVATWPDKKLGAWLYTPRGLSVGTLTGWGRESYFLMEGKGDRRLTQYERQCLREALIEFGASNPTEELKAQKNALAGLAENGLLTQDEAETATGPAFQA